MAEYKSIEDGEYEDDAAKEDDGVTFDNGIIDLQFIPYMRGIGIFFKGYGLRPNRKIWFYFDNTMITDYIVDTSSLRLNQNNNVAIFNAGFGNTDFVHLSSNSNAGGLLITQTQFYPSDDDGSDKPRKRILRLAGLTSTFVSGDNIVGSQSDTTGTVSNFTLGGGLELTSFFATASSNTIQLPSYTSRIANNHWGINGSNAIYFVPKESEGSPVKAYIGNGTRGFDNVSQTLYLSNTWTQLSTTVDDMPQFGADQGSKIAFTIQGNNYRVGQQGLGWYTDSEGNIDGIFIVQPGKYKVGQRVFTIIDNGISDFAESTTRAQAEFIASGLLATKQEVTIKAPKPPPNPPKSGDGGGDGGDNGGDGGDSGGGGDNYGDNYSYDTGDNSGPSDLGNNFDTYSSDNSGDNCSSSDPIAQTFYVDSDVNKNGIFLSSVEVFFRSKDVSVPMQIFLRPTVNGYPSAYQNIPGTRVVKASEFINVSEDATVPTKFTFDSPVYLPPGEYALVLYTSSPLYEVFVAELGGKIIGTDRIVSEQPYFGSLFRSQNSTTWEPDQTKDLMLRMYKCRFVPTGDVELHNIKPTSNVPIDIIYTHIDDEVLDRTTIDYLHSYDYGLSYYDYTPDTNRIMIEGRQYLSNTTNGQYRLQASMRTVSPDVSPIIYHNTGLLNVIENYIDAGSIKDYSIIIEKAGAGYTPNTNLSMSITSSYGSGANGWARTNSTGSVVDLTFDSYGTNYIDRPIARLLASNATTTNAVITFSSEEDSRGGQLLSKYISRTVTLAEGFEAADLRVWLTAYKPSGTNVKVYYKIRNTLDPEPFTDKPWVLMNQYTGSNVFSATRTYSDAREFEYRTPVDPDPLSYVTNDGTGTYDWFNQYAIKIILTSSDTTNYPILYDMRAIALPGLSPS